MIASPLLQRQGFWFGLVWVFFTFLLAVSLYALIASPSGTRWDRAVAVGVCDGLAVLRQEDGSLWLRVSGVRTYRIEGDWKEICR
jgi:hypothetical protein